MLNRRRRLRGVLLALAAFPAPSACLSSGAAGPAEGTFVTLSDGGRLFYEAWGSGPPVVLIHGAELDRRLWDPQYARLAQQFRVIRYDVRGYGRSPWKPGGDFRSHEDLGALLDSLGIRQASLVGLSLGGRIAIDFAIAYPRRVDRLVLIGPGMSGFPSAPPDSAWLEELVHAIRARDSVAAAEVWLRSTLMAPAMKRRALDRRVRTLALENSGVFLRYGERFSHGRTLEPPAFERLGEVRAPALVIIGDHDAADLHAIADTIVARVSGGCKAVVPGAGHVPNLERPALVTRWIVEFLRGERSCGTAPTE